MAELKINMVPKKSIKIGRLTREMKPRLKRGLAKAGTILAKQIKKHLTGAGAVRGVKGRSTPGQGFSGGGGLRGTVNFKLEPDGLTVNIGPNKAYAAIHEFGGTITQTISKKQHWYLGLNKDWWLPIGSTLKIRIPARPYVAPAWQKKGKDAITAIQKAIMKRI